jgi:predicted nucleotidyltransferase component of viral defense system
VQQVATAGKRQRGELFQDTAEEADIDKIIIEKDFWVCWVLQNLYVIDTWRDRLLFKGGTSLSKAFKLIDRFSEDIDLVLKVEGFPEEAMLEDRPD